MDYHSTVRKYWRNTVRYHLILRQFIAEMLVIWFNAHSINRQCYTTTDLSKIIPTQILNCWSICLFQGGGGSRQSEFRKIPEEIFQKSVTKKWTFETSATFSVTFYKKINHKKETFEISATFFSVFFLKNLESQWLFSVTFWKIPEEVNKPTPTMPMAFLFGGGGENETVPKRG